MSFTVRVDGSGHHDARTRARAAPATFETLDEAIGVAKRIVDDYLEAVYEPGMSVQQLWQTYAMYGEVPFITSEELTASPFSAWSYASERIRSWKIGTAAGTGGSRPEQLPR